MESRNDGASQQYERLAMSARLASLARAVCGECFESLEGYLPGATFCDDCSDGI